LHKNLNIVWIVWTKKIERLRKEHFSLIIEFINFEMINRLIKNDLLNDYSHQVCEYFEKKCKIKQCFRCQKYDHVNKTCRNNEKCDFCACEHSSFECRTFNEHKNVLIALTSILLEAFSATLKRRRSKNSTRYEITNRSCTSKHRQMKKQRWLKNDFTSSRSRKCARSLRFNKRWIFRHSKARSMISRWWVSIWTKTLTNFSFFSQFMISAVIRKNHQSSRRRYLDVRSALCK
jgi:hypothetical protein